MAPEAVIPALRAFEMLKFLRGSPGPFFWSRMVKGCRAAAEHRARGAIPLTARSAETPGRRCV